MKKFLLLVVFTISCFFVYTLNTHAANTLYWGDDYTIPSHTWYRDCTDYNCTSHIGNSKWYGYNGDNKTGFVMSNSAKTVAYNSGGSGIQIGIRMQEKMSQSNAYSITLNYCSLNITSTPKPIRFCSGYEGSNHTDTCQYSVTWLTHHITDTMEQPFDYVTPDDTFGETFGSCYMTTFMFNPDVSGNDFAMQFTTDSTNNSQWALINYTLSDLGYINNLTTSQIQNIINNSGLATATSVSQVQSSVEQVKEDIAIVNGKLSEVDNSIKSQTEQQQKNHDETMNTLKDDDTSGASSEASEFFSGFETDTFGLTSIITAPLNLIGSITSSSCSPLGLEVPFVNETLNLPCMTSIYEEFFGSFLTVYQTITFGIIAYWVCVRIFALVKDFKNPDHDEIEVMDL